MKIYTVSILYTNYDRYTDIEYIGVFVSLKEAKKALEAECRKTFEKMCGKTHVKDDERYAFIIENGGSYIKFGCKNYDRGGNSLSDKWDIGHPDDPWGWGKIDTKILE